MGVKCAMRNKFGITGWQIWYTYAYIHGMCQTLEEGAWMCACIHYMCVAYTHMRPLIMMDWNGIYRYRMKFVCTNNKICHTPHKSKRLILGWQAVAAHFIYSRCRASWMCANDVEKTREMSNEHLYSRPRICF